MAQIVARGGPPDALLDAAERLLIAEGHAAISTRRVAEEAGMNHGLVHYYFGSMEELFVQVLERFTGRLIDRQRAMYAEDVPFIDKWRTAMSYLDSDQASGYQKIWFELQALAWNRADLRHRVARVNAEWRAVLTDAFERAARDYGIDTEAFPVPAIVSLVMTFNEGMILEGLSGVGEGQQPLLDAIDGWLQKLEGGRP
ncbi:MAG: TetR/AcrR family transcriptional regulator [Actinomycetota bacterium]